MQIYRIRGIGEQNDAHYAYLFPIDIRQHVP